MSCCLLGVLLCLRVRELFIVVSFWRGVWSLYLQPFFFFRFKGCCFFPTREFSPSQSSRCLLPSSVSNFHFFISFSNFHFLNLIWDGKFPAGAVLCCVVFTALFYFINLFIFFSILPPPLVIWFDFFCLFWCPSPHMMYRGVDDWKEGWRGCFHAVDWLSLREEGQCKSRYFYVILGSFSGGRLSDDDDDVLLFFRNFLPFFVLYYFILYRFVF